MRLLTAPLFDHHSHLDDPDGDIDCRIGALRQLVAAGWPGAVIPGYAPSRYPLARRLQAAVPGRTHQAGLWRAVGLHPEALAAGLPAEAWALFEAELDAPGVVAVGEIGLDRRYRERLPLDTQLRLFRKGLETARSRHLPVVLHLVGWHGHALELLRHLPPPGGVVHRWSGAVELVPAFEALGLHVSLSLEPREHPDKRRQLAQAIRGDRLLLETDWPFLDLEYPQALDRLRDLLSTVAAWRGEPEAELAVQLADNVRAVYGTGP
jgi:TatD DNase family protein